MVKCVNNCQIFSELNSQYLPRDACNSKLIFICCLVCYLIVSMFSSLFTSWNACILRSRHFHGKKRERNGNWNKCLNVHLWPGPKQSKVYSSASYKRDRSGRSILDCYFFFLNVFFSVSVDLRIACSPVWWVSKNSYFSSFTTGHTL